MARKIIKETFKKENGQLVKYPLGADVKNVVITKVDSSGNEIIEKTLDKELDIIKKDSANAAYPSYSIENIETESLEKLTKGESISSSMRKLYKVTSRFINHLKNITSGENHIPTGGKEGDILLWSSDGQAQWGPDANTTYSNFQGATVDEAGKAGLVPAPAAAEQNKFLKGDGTWGRPDNAVYTQGVGISISNNQISLASSTTEKTNVGGTSDTTGLEMTIPYFSFDKYGRMISAGTRKHTMPNSTFVGGTLTENLYFGSTDYSIDTNGDAILNTLKFKNDSRTTVTGLDGDTFKFKANIGDENSAYENTSDGNHIFYNAITLNSFIHTDENAKVMLVNKDGSLTKSSINSAELYQLKNATSNIQSQLNTKVNKSGDTMTGALKFGSDDYYIDASGNATLKNVNADNVNSKGYSRIDITSQTLDLNDFNLNSGSPHIEHYRCRTSGGAANISNIPVTGHPFVLDVELIRWASTTDYISRQIFTSSGDKQNEYVRYCTNGTWEENWTKRVFTDTKYSTATASANGLMSSSDKTKLNNISLSVKTINFSDYTNYGTGNKRSLGTITLSPGFYLIQGNIIFSSSYYKGGYAIAKFSTTEGDVGLSNGVSTEIYIPVIDAAQTSIQMSIHTFLYLDKETTYHLNIQNNSTANTQTVKSNVKVFTFRTL